MLETIGTAILLAVIVWITYRYYGTPESEYLKVLDTLPVNDFSYLDTAEIEERIEITEQNLKELDAHIERTKKKKSKKRYRLHHQLESIKLSLLTYELHKRECEKKN